ncbi:MAG: hypothetical protein ACYDGS_09010 [Thermoleophilia bacterium]
MSKEFRAIFGDCTSEVIYEDDDIIKIWNGKFIEVFKKKIDPKKVEMQLDLLVRAIWETAEDEVMEELKAKKKSESETSHKKPTTDPQD